MLGSSNFICSGYEPGFQKYKTGFLNPLSLRERVII